MRSTRQAVAGTRCQKRRRKDDANSWVEVTPEAGGVPCRSIRDSLHCGNAAKLRMLHQLRDLAPADVTARLHFAAREATPVDLGAGPILMHPQDKPGAPSCLSTQSKRRREGNDNNPSSNILS